MPLRPWMVAPVGKSGPCTYCSMSPGSRSGFSSSASRPSQISPRLWGGILVAMPTAMPSAPLTSRLGTREGMTDGISREPS